MYDSLSRAHALADNDGRQEMREASWWRDDWTAQIFSPRFPRRREVATP